MLRDGVHAEQDFLKSRMWTLGPLRISIIIARDTKTLVSGQAWQRKEKAKRRSKRWDPGGSARELPCYSTVSCCNSFLLLFSPRASFNSVPSHLQRFQIFPEQSLYLFSKDGFILLLHVKVSPTVGVFKSRLKTHLCSGINAASQFWGLPLCLLLAFSVFYSALRSYRFSCRCLFHAFLVIWIEMIVSLYFIGFLYAWGLHYIYIYMQHLGELCPVKCDMKIMWKWIFPRHSDSVSVQFIKRFSFAQIVGLEGIFLCERKGNQEGRL